MIMPVINTNMKQLKLNYYKKFWKEINAFFPYII
jgi:hypothetical protein